MEGGYRKGEAKIFYPLAPFDSPGGLSVSDHCVNCCVTLGKCPSLSGFRAAWDGNGACGPWSQIVCDGTPSPHFLAGDTHVFMPVSSILKWNL